MTKNWYICVLQRHGSGTLKYSTGEIYVGEFKNNLKVGYGEMKYSAVKKYKGQWENDMVKDLCMI